MELLRDFKKINKSDVSLAGGKGASLGEMTKAGISVPPGFVILSPAFENFLEETDLNVEIEAILDSVNHKEIHTVENASEKIEALILQASMPQDVSLEIQKFFKNLNSKYVAVRSSATAEDSASAAWAGQLESYLNTTKENLLENVKKCWASLFTPRAIFYRFEKDLHKQKISVAVVVQKMIESEKSGIAFSVHPVTQDRNQLIIEAGFGLGEAIVSGQITPDSYVVEKQPQQIIDKNVQTQPKGLYRAKGGGNEWRDISKDKGEKQVLSDSEILELSEVILNIENHYGFPCDIEWAFENNKFYIVQSRPITTLNKKDENDSSLSDKLLRTLGSKKLMRVDGDFIPFLVMIDWLNYYDANNRYKNIYPAIFYFSKDRTVAFLTQSYAECARETLDNLLSDRMNIKEISARYDKSAKNIADTYSTYFSENLFEKNSEENLLETYSVIYKELQELVARTLFIEQMDESIVRSELSKYKYNTKSIDNLWDIVRMSYFLSFETRNNQVLLDVIDGKKSIDYLHYAFLNYTFIPDVDYLSGVINKADAKKIRGEIDEVKNNLQKSRKEYHEKIDKLSDQDRKAVEILSWVMENRDERRDLINMSEMLLFKISEKLYSLWGLEKSLVKYTGMFEVLLGKEKILSMHEQLKNRPNGFGVLYNPDHSYQITDESFDGEIKELDQIILDQNKTDDNLIRGEVGNKGKVIGKVHIILKRNQFDSFKDGEVLVTGMTRPEFVPLMRKSIAIITDEGGITSHAAIVSRELNKPCIIGTKIATQVLKDGATVEVNANSGIVRIIENR